MGDATKIFEAIRQGDPAATEELLPLVYDELRRLASKKIARESPGHTLQATALVHEVYLRLTKTLDCHWNDREHFLAAAAEAMRRILVDSARRKQSAKRGGDMQRSPLVEDRILSPCPDVDMLALNEALEKLESSNEKLSALVKLRFFAGMTLDEISEAMNVPRRSIDRMWTYARVWLLREVGPLE